MKCPYCKAEDTAVIDSRESEDGVLRPERWQVVFLIIGSLYAGAVMAQLILLGVILLVAEAFVPK